jgi:hypothetical protein
MDRVCRGRLGQALDNQELDWWDLQHKRMHSMNRATRLTTRANLDSYYLSCYNRPVYMPPQ